MRTRLVIFLPAFVCLACGPRAPVEEPGPEPVEDEIVEDEIVEDEEATESEEAAAGDPGTEPDAPSAEPKDVEGSASGTEVKPMSVKDFDVSTEVDFDPSPAKEKKASAIEKIGMATASTTDCYLDLLTKQPELEGKIEIAFSITPGGAAKAVKAAENTTGSAKLEKCAIKAFKSKKFPKKLAGKKPVRAVVTITLLPYK